MYFDTSYIFLVLLPGLVISWLSQRYLQNTFVKWSQVANSKGVNGMQVARILFDRTSLNPIPVEQTPGSLTDHYDSQKDVVRLSDPIANQPSVAAMAVAAHELGHVQQYQTKSGLIALRSTLLPALRISPTLSYMAIFAGFMFNLMGLVWVGILFFGVVVLFSILTLPVELDASRRAMVLLQEAGLLQDPQEAKGARSVLNAAAFTYVGAAITSVLQLLYYVNLAQRQRR